jgi:hypothetical protein
MSVETGSDTSKIIVFVRLLDEGTPVYRPVCAMRLGAHAYRLDAMAEYESSDERWEFPPGSIVEAEARQLGTEAALVAIRLHPWPAGEEQVGH